MWRVYLGPSEPRHSALEETSSAHIAIPDVPICRTRRKGAPAGEGAVMWHLSWQPLQAHHEAHVLCISINYNMPSRKMQAELCLHRNMSMVQGDSLVGKTLSLKDLCVVVPAYNPSAGEAKRERSFLGASCPASPVCCILG